MDSTKTFNAALLIKNLSSFRFQVWLFQRVSFANMRIVFPEFFVLKELFYSFSITCLFLQVFVLMAEPAQQFGGMGCWTGVMVFAVVLRSTMTLSER